MEELFEYLHLLNEARGIDKNDYDLKIRRENVCNAIEKQLGIQKNEETTCKFDSCEIPIIKNYYTVNNFDEPSLSNGSGRIKGLTKDNRKNTGV